MSDNEFENNYFSGGDNEFAYQRVNFRKPRKMGWSLVSFVSGLISVMCCCLGFAGIVFGALAITAAVFSRIKEGSFDGFSISGLVLGIIGIVCGVAVLVAVLSLGEEFWNEYIEEFKKQYQEMTPDL